MREKLNGNEINILDNLLSNHSRLYDQINDMKIIYLKHLINDFIEDNKIDISNINRSFIIEELLIDL